MGRLESSTRDMLQGMVDRGYLSPAGADEVALVIDEIAELVELGALSRAQGDAIVQQLAMDKAEEYKEAHEQRASA
jgi:hypothetical protein